MPEFETNISEEAAVIKIAKQFVNGKCRNFDTSEIYIIKGEKNSGKSIFCQKFFKFMEVTYDDRVFIKPIHQSEKINSYAIPSEKIMKIIVMRF